jgi:hypothetical protein
MAGHIVSDDYQAGCYQGLSLMSQQLPPSSAIPAAHRWSPLVRLLASLLILLYLTAVLLPPLAGPPPASELAGVMLQPFRPLVGSLALSHGYRFFAPNPGPGHSIRWTITTADGGQTTGLIPDAERDWPRLLYHRRFMIPEKLAAFVPLPEAPAELRQEAIRNWQPLVEDIATRLLARYGGREVSLDLIEHYLPDTFEVREGRGGDDLVMPLGRYRWRGEASR